MEPDERVGVWGLADEVFPLPELWGDGWGDGWPVDSVVPEMLGSVIPSVSKAVQEEKTKKAPGTGRQCDVEKKKRVRLDDMRRKKETRKTTRVLLRTLWDLETEYRQGEKPVPRSRRPMLHTVLEEMTRRLKIIRDQPEPGSAAAADQYGVLQGDVLMAGMLEARSVGVLYVCVEDWVVRESNRAVELFCSFEPMRGYVGLELCGFVHPDDHGQLAMLQQEQVHSYRPGESLVLSVRLLRACMDGRTLVMGWRRQLLEVAHIGADEHGKLHVLFTFVPDKASLEQLTFDASERLHFQETAAAVSGSMTMDPHRTTTPMDELCEMIDDIGIQETSGTSTVSDFLYGVSSRVGRAMGIPQLLSHLQRGARSTLNSIVRVHVLLGLDPEGTPCYQKSVALCGFGLMSNYHAYLCASASGRPLPAAMPRIDSPSHYVGVLKPEECTAMAGGGDAVGFVLVGIAMGLEGPQEQAHRVVSVGQSLFMCNPEHGSTHERTWITFHGRKRGWPLPDKNEFFNMRVAPPDPGLLEKFKMFGVGEGERLGIPFPEFLRRR